MLLREPPGSLPSSGVREGEGAGPGMEKVLCTGSGRGKVSLRLPLPPPDKVISTETCGGDPRPKLQIKRPRNEGTWARKANELRV